MYEKNYYVWVFVLSLCLVQMDVFSQDNGIRLGFGNRSCMDVSSDGKTVATGGTQGILIWSEDNGYSYPVQWIDAHDGDATSIKFSPDDSQLLSCGLDSGVILWDAASGEMVRQFTGHTAKVRDIDFFHTKNQIISVGDNHEVIIWDIQTSGIVEQYTIDDNPVEIEVASNDNNLLLRTYRTLESGSNELRLDLYQVEGFNLINTLWTVSPGSIPFGFSPDGQYAVASGDNSLHFYETTDGTELFTIAHDDDRFTNSFSFSSDGKQLLAAQSNSVFVLWDIEQQSVINAFEELNVAHNNLFFHPEQNRFIVGGNGANPIYFVNLETIEELHVIGGFNDSTVTYRMAFSNDSKYLAVDVGINVNVWDVNTGGLVDTFRGDLPPKNVWSNVNDQNWILYTDRLPIVKIKNIDSGEIFEQQNTMLPRLSTHIQVSTNQPIVLLPAPLGSSANSFNEIQLINFLTNEIVHVIEYDGIAFSDTNIEYNQNSMFEGLTFSPDGTKLAINQLDDTIQVFDLSNETNVLNWTTLSVE